MMYLCMKLCTYVCRYVHVVVTSRKNHALLLQKIPPFNAEMRHLKISFFLDRLYDCGLK